MFFKRIACSRFITVEVMEQGILYPIHPTFEDTDPAFLECKNYVRKVLTNVCMEYGARICRAHMSALQQQKDK